MKAIKTTIAVLALAFTCSVYATPTLIISDGTTSTSLTSASGIVTYANAAFDGFWSVVIDIGQTKPAIGSAPSPQFDLNVQATSQGVAGHDLVVKLSDNNFGATSGNFDARLTGHVVSGTGANVSYNTYYDAANVTGATTTLLTATGSLTPPNYGPIDISSGPFNQALYSLTQVLTISSAPDGSYSLDASLAIIPEPSTLGLLLLATLSGLPLLRRKTT